MASSSQSVSSSTALIVYQPRPVTYDTLTREVFRRSWETAKYEIGCLNPETPLADRRLTHFFPRPTGPYPVSFTHFTLLPGEEHKGDRKIGVEIHTPNLDLLSEQQIQTLRIGVGDQLDLAQRVPLIIFSHGFGGLAVDYLHLVEEIASQGFTVVCLNHPSSSCHSLFLEKVDEMERSAPDEVPAVMEKLAQTQAANIGFVLDALRGGSVEELSHLRHAQTIVLAGHSLGGAASVLVARSHPCISACINLDGGLAGDDQTKMAGLTQPILTLRSDFDITDPYLERFYNEWVALHENSSPHSQFETIPGIGHVDFTISPFIDWLDGEQGIDAGIRAHETTSRKILQLMQRIRN